MPVISAVATAPGPREQVIQDRLEQAIADALDSKRLKKLPVKPRREITHLMVKAAVAVSEGVVEGQER